MKTKGKSTQPDKLTTKERKELKDSDFGLPEDR